MPIFTVPPPDKRLVAATVLKSWLQAQTSSTMSLESIAKMGKDLEKALED